MSTVHVTFADYFVCHACTKESFGKERAALDQALSSQPGGAAPSSLLSSFVSQQRWLTEHKEREGGGPNWLATINARVSALKISFPKLFDMSHCELT